MGKGKVVLVHIFVILLKENQFFIIVKMKYLGKEQVKYLKDLS